MMNGIKCRFCIALLMIALLAATASLAETLSVQTMDTATAAEANPGYSRYIDVPGVGPWYYYAQNDPVWDESVYEQRRYDMKREFGSGGCGPTSLAIALSKQLTPEEMMAINDHRNPSRDGYFYCPCSVNTYHCNNRHEPIKVETAEDFLYNLPQVLGAYATGNNERREMYRADFAGTSINLFKHVARDYGLEYYGTSDWETVYAELQAGASVITTVTKGIFTGSSHYMVVAHADEEYVYILDPLMRTEYPNDKRGVLEILEPGLLRAKMSDFGRLSLHGYYILKKDKGITIKVEARPE